MTATLFETSFALFQMIYVIAVCAYILTRSRYFSEFLKGHPTITANLARLSPSPGWQ